VKKRKDHRDVDAFSDQIFRISKGTYPNMGFKRKGMLAFNQIIADLFENIVNEAMLLCQYHSKQTLTSKEIETAVKLILPGELRSRAVEEIKRALAQHKLKQGANCS